MGRKKNKKNKGWASLPPAQGDALLRGTKESAVGTALAAGEGKKVVAETKTETKTTTTYTWTSARNTPTYSKTPHDWNAIDLDMALLTDVLYMDTNDLYMFCADWLLEYGYTIHGDMDNYLIGIPHVDAPTCRIGLVSHIDTLATRGVDLYLDNGHLRNTKGVLGADDRAGVYTLLKIVEDSEIKPVIIFTNYEERGGIGVGVLCRDKAYDLFTDLVDFFVEPDRKGTDEYVYYSDYLPEEFATFVESFGLHECIGSYSDVKDLSECTSIPHINMSIGYFGQHTICETLSLMDLDYAVKRLMVMLQADDLPNVRLSEEKAKEMREAKWAKYKGASLGYGYYGNSYGDEYDYGATGKRGSKRGKSMGGVYQGADDRARNDKDDDVRTTIYYPSGRFEVIEDGVIVAEGTTDKVKVASKLIVTSSKSDKSLDALLNRQEGMLNSFSEELGLNDDSTRFDDDEICAEEVKKHVIIIPDAENVVLGFKEVELLCTESEADEIEAQIWAKYMDEEDPSGIDSFVEFNRTHYGPVEA